MSIQSSVLQQPAFGLPGMDYDGRDGDDVSKIAAVDIPFGAYVTFDGETCKLPTATGDVSGKPGGIALMSPTGATNLPTPGGYKAGDIVSVRRKGRVWILSETALVVHSQPYVRHAAGTLGVLRNTADTANATLVPNASMYTGVAAAGLAVLELNNP